MKIHYNLINESFLGKLFGNKNKEIAEEKLIRIFEEKYKDFLLFSQNYMKMLVTIINLLKQGRIKNAIKFYIKINNEINAVDMEVFNPDYQQPFIFLKVEIVDQFDIEDDLFGYSHKKIDFQNKNAIPKLVNLLHQWKKDLLYINSIKSKILTKFIKRFKNFND